MVGCCSSLAGFLLKSLLALALALLADHRDCDLVSFVFNGSVGCQDL